MFKSRSSWKRILVVLACSLVSLYAGIRSSADVLVSRTNFKGFSQTVFWPIPNGYASMRCTENVTGPGKPTASPVGEVQYHTDSSNGQWIITDLIASGTITPNSMVYTPTLGGTTRCGFTGLPGTLSVVDWSVGYNVTNSDVTVTADSALTAASTQVTHLVQIQTSRSDASRSVFKTETTGTYGMDITGLGGIAMTDNAGSTTVIVPEGTPVEGFDSYNNYAKNGTYSRYSY